jgi:hypothetical protein
MEPRYYDAAGHIDYEAIKAYAGELRREASDAFWSGLFPAAASFFARRAAAFLAPAAIAPSSPRPRVSPRP